ncbi:hypothetical protein TNCV_1696911 [Trichonephila clavipes]|nr:hypothetical protein TNCV_1696911 [Trichonephila clavipes]
MRATSAIRMDILETVKPTENAEFEEDLYKCKSRLDDLEARVEKLINFINLSLSVTAVEKNKYENGTLAQTKISPLVIPLSFREDVLINFRLNRVAISSDIRQAFLQICLADKHKDFVRFLRRDIVIQVPGKSSILNL